MISQQGIRLALVGIAIGAAIAFAVTRMLSSLLYDVSATDPLTFVGSCIALLGIAALASWVPARRAAAVNPADTLKNA